MPVKPSQSGSRILSALEMIAEHQPLGVTDLARLLADNVAATQRALATLAEDGWIRPAAGKPTRWELTAHIHTVAQHAYGSHDLRRRARPALEALWQETGESVLLNVPDAGRFIVIDVLESPQYLRTAPPVGLIVPASWGSATARALLPYMSSDERMLYLGEPPDAALQRDFLETVERGYAVSEGDVMQGSTNIAAPVFEIDKRPVAAVLVSAPTARIDSDDRVRLGAMVKATAEKLSRGAAPFALL